MGHKLKDEIPGAVLAKIPGRSHALPTEEPVLCASLIGRFQAGLPAEALGAGLLVTIYPGTSAPRSIEAPAFSQFSQPSKKF